ncbi:MAG: protein kinase [Puniceicoccaceae bacterium]
MNGDGDSTRDARVRELFIKACEFSTQEERIDYIKEACKEDSRMEEQIVSLLSVHEESNALMEMDLLTEIEGFSNNLIGSMIGRYRVLEKVGEGGFGEVFRVEQSEPIQRELALKIIKPGMDSKDVIRRFESERQALARLDHPNIAYIIDAGASDSGRPYFVMELVIGLPVTRYCDQHLLSIDERLELFRQVCDGVHHAHKRGIIHRDLNPSNIIVVEQDGQRIPKIIDFGIAKSLQGHLTGKTVMTQRQYFVGTPDYMSPEQFTLSSSELDDRTDIYTLGAVLYELVSGAPPLAGVLSSNAGIMEIHRIHSEEEPIKPSTRIRTVEEAKSIAERRATSISKLSTKLHGDLDHIVMQCLAKDRTRRYDTAGSLGRDLKAFLANQPIEATAPGPVHQLRKLFVRKKQALTTWIAITAVALAIGVTLLNFWTGQPVGNAIENADKSIAILPFEHLSSDEDYLFFTEGIHHDLLAQISKMDELSVISRNSVMEYRNTDKNLKTIAEELGVVYVIEGSVQRAGDEVRIHVQMIDTREDTNVLAESYTRDLNAENVFDVQTDIAESVALQLEVVIEGEFIDFPTYNIEALEAYYRGIECILSQDISSKKQAIAYFEQAIEADPNFALAHVEMANTLSTLKWWTGLPYESIHAKVESHIFLALQIDASLSNAYSVLGRIRMQQRDYAAAEEALDRAIDLNPNDAMAIALKSDLLGLMPGWDDPVLVNDERLALLKKACELDPASVSYLENFLKLLYAQGKDEEALEVIQKEEERRPNSPIPLLLIGEWHAKQQQYDEAIIARRRAHAIDPNHSIAMHWLMFNYWYLNELETADFWFKRYLKVEKDPYEWFKRKAWHANLLQEWDKSAYYAEKALETDPKQIYLLQMATRAYLAKGEPMKARVLWLKAYPELFEPKVEVDRILRQRARDLAYVLKQTGEKEHADHLLSEVWEYYQYPPPGGDNFSKAKLHILGGDFDKALASIRNYVDRGFRSWDLRFDPAFDVLNDNPEYKSLLAEADARLAQQSQRLREMELRGELAPIPGLKGPLGSSEIPPTVESLDELGL